ncbi:MAG TPA: sulfotransferase [Geminicoccaceae bacterium]|nr:sulfotransferase [Geminicoccaceae bacterium]
MLLVSLPRSGSTWVGDVLGSAPDALYLHEPLTQSLDLSGTEPILVEPDAPAPAAVYPAAAAAAFAGLPTFRSHVLRWPGQWALGRRAGRRVVVKEVNPLICPWIVREHRPRVILLVRHPAAVSLSYRRLGWFDLPDFQMASGDGAAGDGPWRRSGRRQGYVLDRALRALSGYPDHVVVRYEDLCRQPVEGFRRLYAFAGLTWTPAVGRLIEAKAGGDRNDVYATSRATRLMADSWRAQIGPQDLADLMAGYGAFDLPWYGAAEPSAAA